MYRELFHAMTNAIESLQQAQIKTEEMYMSVGEPVSSSLRLETDGEDKNTLYSGCSAEYSVFHLLLILSEAHTTCLDILQCIRSP